MLELVRIEPKPFDESIEPSPHEPEIDIADRQRSIEVEDDCPYSLEHVRCRTLPMRLAVPLAGRRQLALIVRYRVRMCKPPALYALDTVAQSR